MPHQKELIEAAAAECDRIQAALQTLLVSSITARIPCGEIATAVATLELQQEGYAAAIAVYDSLAGVA